MKSPSMAKMEFNLTQVSFLKLLERRILTGRQHRKSSNQVALEDRSPFLSWIKAEDLLYPDMVVKKARTNQEQKGGVYSQAL